jgi:hypothetical protein
VPATNIWKSAREIAGKENRLSKEQPSLRCSFITKTKLPRPQPYITPEPIRVGQRKHSTPTTTLCRISFTSCPEANRSYSSVGHVRGYTQRRQPRQAAHSMTTGQYAGSSAAEHVKPADTLNAGCRHRATPSHTPLLTAAIHSRLKASLSPMPCIHHTKLRPPLLSKISIAPSDPLPLTFSVQIPFLPLFAVRKPRASSIPNTAIQPNTLRTDWHPATILRR